LTAIPLRGVSYAVVFIESRAFTRRLTELAGDSADDVLRQIEYDLLEHPQRGRIVKGLGGIRKGRVPNPARRKGKRGGFRYFYLYFIRDQQVGLLFLLDKDEQEDLNPAERKLLRELAAESRR
jgi:hypothetical protein